MRILFGVTFYLLAFLSIPLFADTVHLKNGGKLDDVVLININGTTPDGRKYSYHYILNNKGNVRKIDYGREVKQTFSRDPKWFTQKQVDETVQRKLAILKSEQSRVLRAKAKNSLDQETQIRNLKDDVKNFMKKVENLEAIAGGLRSRLESSENRIKALDMQKISGIGAETAVAIRMFQEEELMTGALWRSLLLPGWGQVFKEEKLKGVGFLTLWAGALNGISLQAGRVRKLDNEIKEVGIQPALVPFFGGGVREFSLALFLSNQKIEQIETTKRSDENLLYGAGFVLAIVYGSSFYHAYNSKSGSGFYLRAGPGLPSIPAPEEGGKTQDISKYFPHIELGWQIQN